MCLAGFAATYSTDYRPQSDDVNNDALDVESETNTNKIRLTGGFGCMRERRRPAIIRDSEGITYIPILVCLVIVAAWLSRLFRAKFSLLLEKSTLKMINFTASMYSTL